MLKDLIKAGKGYRDGRPVGIVGRDCDECGEPIISIRMASGQKGQQCTSENVCSGCGLVYQGSFAILDKYEDDYKTKEFESHKDWLAQMKQEPHDYMSDIDISNEYMASIEGKRESEGDDVGYGHGGIQNKPKPKKHRGITFKTRDGKIVDSKERYNLANNRTSKTCETYRMSNKDYSKKKCLDFIDYLYNYFSNYAVPIKDYKLMLEDAQLIVEKAADIDVKGISIFHRNASREEIIASILLWRASKTLGRKVAGLRSEMIKQGFITKDKNNKCSNYMLIKNRLEILFDEFTELNIRPIARPTRRGGRLAAKTFAVVDKEISKHGYHLKPKLKFKGKIKNTPEEKLFGSGEQCATVDETG
jgi:hypothetical protein